MGNYIDAEKLKAEIEIRMGDCKLPDGKFPTTTNAVRYEELLCLLNFIVSLYQEQPILPGIEEEGVPGKDYIPVEWVDACEKYGKWKIIQKEQPEVDLEKEIDACWQNWVSPSNQKEVEGVLPKIEFATYASHFYKLGLNARKEA